MMSKTTKYTCIKTFSFRTNSRCNGGEVAFTKGTTYEGWQDKRGFAEDIELTDDTGKLHTITADLFPSIFKECK